MRYAWLGAMVLGCMPAIASADHHSSFSLSIGVGYDYYRDYYVQRYDAPVYYSPPVVYERVYSPPPIVVYEPPVIYDRVVIDPCPGGCYTYRSYRHTQYYYGR